MRSPIHVALIWHFHQPDYTDPRTGAPTMPWTRLHALKDYADMAAHLERHPAVRVTFNVVPTLLDQLRSLARADAPPDPFLVMAAKPAAALTREERAFLVGHFFSLHRERMAAGWRRYDELAALRGPAPAALIGAVEVARFDEQALRDLQVLFHLAWSGSLLRADPLVTRLLKKGRGFNEEEKQALLARQREYLADVLPRWRRLADSGQIEFSVTPYYHPILPLLCDTWSAREAVPELALPAARFRHPEDADIQLAQGMEAFEAAFGRRAAGGWPSEGAISEDALDRLSHAGYRWAASDEDVLFASLDDVFPADAAAQEALRAELLYRPGPALPRSRPLGPDRIQLCDAFTRGSGTRLRRPAPPSARDPAGRWGAAGRQRHPRRRERLGTVSRSRGAVLRRALRSARPRARHPDADRVRSRRPGGGESVAADRRGVVDLPEPRDLGRSSGKESSVGAARRRA
jgi:alpha-amylase/alpha-mannosidase (GH57 family)